MLFLDHNSTTALDPAVWEAMRPWMLADFGNPSSSHRAGRRARQALDDSRAIVARLLDAGDAEVIFTSGATEANNLAVFGLCPESPAPILASAIEHPCVTEPMKVLQKRGYPVYALRVDASGIAILDDLPAVRFASLMRVNHETGSIQPVAELRSRLGESAVIHCDAAQAVGKIPVSFRDLKVDALTLSAHKFHGPRGIGALLVRKGRKPRPLVYGGFQQQGYRPGTENHAFAVGLAVALELAVSRMDASRGKVTELRERLLAGLRAKAPGMVCNSPTVESGLASPYVVNVSFPGARAEVLLMKLDLMGIACSTGSACSSGSLLPSPVLEAMGVPPEVLDSAMRFSFDPSLTDDEIDTAVGTIADAVARLRAG